MCQASEIDLDPETYNRRGQVWYVVKQEEITEGSSYMTFYLEIRMCWVDPHIDVEHLL